MGDWFIGTILAWAPDFAPQGWLFCNGQLVSIKQNQALFSLLGTRYGGDGVNNFALPNLNGRVPIGATMKGGVIPSGVSTYQLGATGGNEDVTLTVQNMPVHTHDATTTTSELMVSGLNVEIPVSSTSSGDTNIPGNQASLAIAGDSGGGPANIYTTGNTDTYLKPTVVSGGTVSGTMTATVSPAGSGQLGIRKPYQALNYIICVQGFYPSRT